MKMEGNKDESNRCAGLAKQYFAMGDYEKARKFMTKAHKLFQSDETKKWLEDLSEYSSNNNKENKPSSRSKSPATANNYRRDDEYTSEQKKLVTRVNSCKDYYEVLEVAKDASDSDIKKAYKKIALKLHPDKNKCPGAAEAFKKVGHAVAVLTDCEKRKQYDLCGPDFANKKSHAASNSFRAYEFEQDTNVDEIFNLFFGGGFNRPNVYMRTRAGPNGFFTNTTAFRREHHNHSTDNDGPLTQIMQICPLLFAILISLLLSYLQTPPVFSIKPIGEYNVQYYTPHLKLPFFSKANFQSTFDGSLSALEEKIIYEMKVECQREIQRREQRIFSARLSYDEQAIKEASNFKTPFCDILQRKHVISV